MSSLALFLAIGIVGAACQILLKAGLTEVGHDPRTAGMFGHAVAFGTNFKLIMAALLYVGTFTIYLLLLMRHPVSAAYPVSIAVNFVLVTIAAAVFLGERMTAMSLVGLALIVAGIYLAFPR